MSRFQANGCDSSEAAIGSGEPFQLVSSLLTSESATGKTILMAGSMNKVDKDRVIRRTLGGTRDTILVSLSDAKGRGTSRHRPSSGSR